MVGKSDYKNSMWQYNEENILSVPDSLKNGSFMVKIYFLNICQMSKWVDKKHLMSYLKDYILIYK